MFQSAPLSTLSLIALVLRYLGWSNLEAAAELLSEMDTPWGLALSEEIAEADASWRSSDIDEDECPCCMDYLRDKDADHFASDVRHYARLDEIQEVYLSEVARGR